MPGVRQWGKKYYIYNDDDREVTHLCLDGGKLSVSFKDVEHFHVKVGADIARGIVNYIVERRTDIFKFHADLDIFEPQIRKYDDILEWIKTDMLTVLKEFYPQFSNSEPPFKELTTFVCTTDGKKGVEKYGKMYDKVGIHLLYPWLLSTTENAMKCRSAFIQYFTKKYGDRPEGCNEWADVFDKTVYVSNGLRMLGNGKMERCKSCRGNFNDNGYCKDGICDGKGKYDVGRIYKINAVINGDGTENKELLEQLLQDEIYMTDICSIRCDPDKINNDVLPAQTLPVWFDDVVEFEPNKSKRILQSNRVVKVKEDDFSSFMVCLEGSRVRLADNDKRVLLIKEWFKNDDIHGLFRIPKKYRESNIQDVIMCTPTMQDRYYLINVDSHWCLNLQSDHKSNGIYFVINEEGLFQKCFCRCATVRLSGIRCEEFTSECFHIPDDLYPMLFSSGNDAVKSHYSDFVDRCESSLANIKDENELMSALMDRMLLN